MKAKTIDEKFWSKFVKGADDECWMWTGSLLRPGGYGNVKYKGRTQPASRVSYELHSGTQIPKGMCVMHSCDNPPCVNPAHLRLGTQAENLREMLERGRHRTRRLLTPEEVLEIRASKRAYGVLTAHARRLGVSVTTVWNVMRGALYREVQ